MKSLSLPMALCITACTTALPPGADVAEQLNQHVAVHAEMRTTTSVVVPNDVDLSDGLSADEAVLIAVRNNADFQARLARTGLSAAELKRANTLPNPLLSSVLGTAWEATLTYPIDFLWKRPARIEAAAADYASEVQQAVQDGIDFILNVRLAHTEVTHLCRKVDLAGASATRTSHLSRLAAAAVGAGEGSALEAKRAAADAAAALQDAARADTECRKAVGALRTITRLNATAWNGSVEPAPNIVSPATDVDALIAFAWENRPDLKAAALNIEAAEARVRVARRQPFSVAGGAKVTESGGDSTTRTAVDPSIPLFDHGQADAMAANARLSEATLLYVARRDQVAQQVRDAATQLEQSGRSLDAWRSEIVVPLIHAVESAEVAFADGDIPYLVVLDHVRSLNDAQLAQADAEATTRRAEITLARHVGGSLPGSARR